MAPLPSLTTHLLASAPAALTHATAHPFLPLAATAALPLPKLQRWLAQDRLYALAYLNFAASLLANLHVPAATTQRPTSLAWRVADALIDCLTGIRAELALFEATAAREGWLSAVTADVRGPDPITRAYADLFAGTTAGGRPLLVGLTALWATEECYLRAWRFAKAHVPSSSGGGGGGGDDGGEGKVGEAAGDVMQRVFIPNWSSDEFAAFVARLRALVDEMGEGVERDGWAWRECEGVWLQVLGLEAEFWPKVDDGEDVQGQGQGQGQQV